MKTIKKNISTLQFYKYKLSIKDDFNPYLNLGKIVQQYIVDQWVRIEGSRFHYYKSHQATLRTEMYAGKYSLTSILSKHKNWINYILIFFIN